MRKVSFALLPVALIYLIGAEPLLAQNGCTFYTQGYWKNHSEAWPVEQLTLGQRIYSKSELLSILRRPVRGNGLVALAHQLIAAKLNVALNEAAGYAIPSDVMQIIQAADSLIGQYTIPPVGTDWLHPSITSESVVALDEFNEGAYSCDGNGGLPG